MGLLEQYGSGLVSSSDDVNTSTSSEQYFSLEDETSDVFGDDVNSNSCSPVVFGSLSRDHISGGILSPAGGGNSSFTYEQQQQDYVNTQETVTSYKQEVPVTNCQKRTAAGTIITILDRILKSRPIWHLPDLGRGAAVHILHTRESGVFVVRQSSKRECLALSVRVGVRPSIEHYIIELAKRGLRLENSFHYFKGLDVLIEYYTHNLDELPVKLQLPLVLLEAETHAKLNAYALMGQDFWSSPISQRSVLQAGDHFVKSLSPKQPRRCSLPVQQTATSKVSSQHSKWGRGQTQSLSQHQSNKTKHSWNGKSTHTTVTTHDDDIITKQQMTSSPDDNRRLSLSQINHSDTSPFSPKVLKESCSSTFSSSRHDYVNVSEMEDKGSLFRPISNRSLVNGEVSTVQLFSEAVVSTSSVLHVPAFPKNKMETDIGKTKSESTSMQEIEEDIEREIESLENMATDLKNQIPEVKKEPAIEEAVHRRETNISSQTRKQAATKHLSLIPHYKKNEPAVFTFDLTMPRGSSSMLHGSNNFSLQSSTGFQLNPSLEDRSPKSANTQYSSPAYVEPFDSLIGKVEGVTNETKGAINVSHFIRQKLQMEKAKCDHSKSYRQTICSHYGATKQLNCSQCDTKQLSSDPFPSPNPAVSKSDTYITGALDASMACNPQYKISLEEIPLVSQHANTIHSAKPSAERSFSLKSLEKYTLDRNSLKTNGGGGVRAQSLPMDNPLCHKPPKGIHNNQHHTKDLPSQELQHSHVYGKQKPLYTNKDENHNRVYNNHHKPDHFRKSLISRSFEENFFSGNENSEDNTSPPVYRQFPLNLTASKRSSFNSDNNSTLEDFLSDFSPELTLEPIKALTQKNLNRISEYDNFCSGFCNHTTSHRGAALSSRKTAGLSSAGTHYSQPWDSSAWQDLLNAPSGGDTAPVTNTQIFNIGAVIPPPLPTPSSHYHPVNPADYYDIDGVSMYSDVLSQLGSDIACSTFEWRKRTDRDSAAETTPQPMLYTEAGYPAGDMYSHSAIFEDEDHNMNYSEAVMSSEGGIVTTSATTTDQVALSDDEGVSIDDVMENEQSAPKVSMGGKRDANTPGCKVETYVSGLAEKAETMFGSHVGNFVKCTLEGTESNPHTVLRNVRQFMNGIKNYLVQHGEKELNDLIELERKRLGRDEFLNVDFIIEVSLHKCVLRPLTSHIYKLFLQFNKDNGRLSEMSESVKYARTKTPHELGIRDTIQPPSGSSMEQIKHYLSKMQKASSPLDKLKALQGATNTMVSGVQSRDRGSSVSSQSTNSTQLATDDLLPMLIYVLVHCGLVTAEIEADYMWALLHPCELAGEGGYCLTTFSSATHLLKNLRCAMEATPGEVRLPCLGDLQGFMKVIKPDEKHNSIITQTLPVRPNMTTKDVCSMMAYRFRITNPQDYGLYVLVMGIEDRVQDSACPQQIKLDLQRDGRDCVFAYKRNNAKYAWPAHFK